MAAAQVRPLETNCAEFGVPLDGFGDPTQGIVHVIGPQLGLTQPGRPLSAATRTRARMVPSVPSPRNLGTSEVEMVLTTQTLLQRDSKTYEVRDDGQLSRG